MNKTDFSLFASDFGINSTTLNQMSNSILPMAGYISPSILEERKLNVTHMDVFSRLMMDRIIFLGTSIDAYTSNVIQAQLLYLASQDDQKPISLYINSPGGSVYDGLGIYDTMQYVSCPVHTTCTGMAASMASILLCAGKAGHRCALPHSRIMIHQPMGSTHGQASDIEIEAKQILKLKDELCQIIADHSGQTLERVIEDSNRDFWMTAAEAVEYGMIDNVLNYKN